MLFTGVRKKGVGSKKWVMNVGGGAILIGLYSSFTQYIQSSSLVFKEEECQQNISVESHFKTLNIDK